MFVRTFGYFWYVFRCEMYPDVLETSIRCPPQEQQKDVVERQSLHQERVKLLHSQSLTCENLERTNAEPCL